MGIKFDKISISGSINSLVTPISPEYWVSTAGISSIISDVDSIGIDSLGNKYTAIRLNNYTVGVFKFSSTGALEWARSVSVDSTLLFITSGLVCDTSNNAYLVAYQRTSNFSDGTVYVIKISPSGSIIWQKSIDGGNNFVSANKFVQRASDQAIVLVGETYYASFGQNDVFHAIVSTAGVVQTTRNIGNSASELGHAVDIDSSGDIWIGGWASFFTGTQGFVTKMSVSNYNALYSRYVDSTNNEDRIYSISVSNSGVYFVGETYFSTNRQAVVGKFDLTGNLLWSRGLYSTATIDYLYSSKVDTDGNLYVSGTSSASLTGQPSVLLAKYSPSGTLLWQRMIDRSDSVAMRSAGFVIDGDDMYVSCSILSQGSALFKLPKDGTLTGTYGVYRYYDPGLTNTTHSVTTGSFTFRSNINPYSINNSSLSLSTATATNSITNIG